MSDFIWKPYGDYIENSNIARFMKKHGISDYQELIARTTDDIEWFWDAMMKDLQVSWYEPYTKVLDDSGGIQWCKWFTGGKTNIVLNCLDRWAEGPEKDKLALVWEGENGEVRRLTYGELYSEVNKMANALKELGVNKGDAIGLYMPMTVEISVALLAALKVGAICIPIFSGFGPAATATRLKSANAKILFTADGSYRAGKEIAIKPNADKAADDVPSLEKVIVLKRNGMDVDWNPERDIWWNELIESQPDTFETERMDSEDIAFIVFTSGTTGRPKGAVHTHGGCLAQMVKELGYYFDVKPDDMFCWVTDMGWMMGPWMVVGVGSLGATYLLFEGSPTYPEPDRLWDLIEKHKINTFGISPTAIRMLLKFPEEWVTKHDLSSLRLLGSTGEAWDPESYMWFFNVVGKEKIPIINISGGTEIVGCFLSPLPISPLKPCTLAGPGLGMDIDVFDEDGKPVRGETGHLVCKKPAPSMTRGFWGEPERYIETYWSKWPNVWYHGDWASVDEDGMWFLHGRSDDVIKVSGRRTGPAEIEEVINELDEVAECAAIGVHDDVTGEHIVSFVVVKPNFEASDELSEKIRGHVSGILGKVFRPKEVIFTSDLPKTRSAKIVRRLIKAKYTGGEIGDLSSVANPEALDEIKPDFVKN